MEYFSRAHAEKFLMRKSCRKQMLLLLLFPACREEKKHKPPAAEELSKTVKANNAATSRLPGTTVCSSCSPAARGSQHLEHCLAWKLYVSVLNAFISALRPIPICRGIILPGSADVCSGFPSTIGCTDEALVFAALQQERSMNFLAALNPSSLASSRTETHLE